MDPAWIRNESHHRAITSTGFSDHNTFMLVTPLAAASLSTASASVRRLTFVGHRTMLAGPSRPSAVARPPLVLLGGTAQWVDSWTGHFSPLARERQVLVYETRGQAGASSTLDVTDCSLERHADDFAQVVEAALGPEPVIDVAAFSFGGRVAMSAAAASAAAAAAKRRFTIRRMCVTGVAADRGPVGRLTLHAWRAALAAGDLEGFVWQLILSTHSPSFLAAHEDKIGAMVSAVVAENSVEGLRAIVEQTHTEDPTDAHHPLAMARAIRAGGTAPEGLLLVGAEDTLSPAAAAEELAAEAGWQCVSIPKAAHAVPIEQAVAWRRELLGFLDAD